MPASVKSDFSNLKAFLFLGFFLLFGFLMTGQNQSVADSLEQIHREGLFEEKDHLRILDDLIREHPDPEKQLMYGNEMIHRAIEIDSISALYWGYVHVGNALRLKGELTLSVENFFRAGEIASEMGDKRKVGLVEIAVASVYHVMENYDNSIRYYKSGLDILREENDTLNILGTLLNLSDTYNKVEKPDSALIYLEEANRNLSGRDRDIYVAYTKGNMGVAFALQGKDAIAKNYISEAIAMLTDLGDTYGISDYLNSMSSILLEQGQYALALSYSLQGLELAHDLGLKEQISDSNLKISQIYEAMGDTISSYKYFKEHVAYKDSLTNITSVQKMADIRTDFEVSQKQLEVDLLNQQRRTQNIITWATGIALFLLTIVVIGVLRRSRYINKTNRIIEVEKNRSEMLLLNILPSETAQELKENGKVKAKRFESVTVLFTDFQGFTLTSQDFTPEKLVTSVDFYFSEFDRIIGKFGLEKIKTIGDSYMCAGGLPFPSEDHPQKVIAAAREILKFMESVDKKKDPDIAHFDIRIGINTGPVVAGVVGTKKFAYDIWGDTVNVAARMESNSKPGKINISENTYALVKDQYNCTFRGKIDVKNHGSMNMYYVNDRKKPKLEKSLAGLSAASK